MAASPPANPAAAMDAIADVVQRALEFVDSIVTVAKFRLVSKTWSQAATNTVGYIHGRNRTTLDEKALHDLQTFYRNNTLQQIMCCATVLFRHTLRELRLADVPPAVADRLWLQVTGTTPKLRAVQGAVAPHRLLELTRRNPRINSLELSYANRCPPWDESSATLCVAALCRLKRLTKLDVSHHGITSLRPVFDQCWHLTTLYAKRTTLISIVGIDALPELTDLDISELPIPPDMSCFQEQLGRCTSLTRLVVDDIHSHIATNLPNIVELHEGFCADGFVGLTLRKPLDISPTLRRLHVVYRPELFGGEDMTRNLEHLTVAKFKPTDMKWRPMALKTVSISILGSITDFLGLVTSLREHTASTLTSLVLRMASATNGQMVTIDNLGAFQRLEKLVLGSSKIKITGSLPSTLTDLDLSGTACDNDTLHLFRDLRHLTSAKIYGCRDASDLRPLASSAATLTELDASRTDCSIADVVDIGLTKLTKFSLQEGRWFDDPRQEAGLSTLSEIRYLDLRRIRTCAYVAVDALQNIVSSMPLLEHLMVGEAFGEDMKPLAKCKRLTTVILDTPPQLEACATVMEQHWGGPWDTHHCQTVQPPSFIVTPGLTYTSAPL
jgi:hypothetical protein